MSTPPPEPFTAVLERMNRFQEPEARAIYVFSAVLAVQSLPFIAAVAITLLERSSFNEFGTWRRLAAALASGAEATEIDAPASNRMTYWGTSLFS